MKQLILRSGALARRTPSAVLVLYVLLVLVVVSLVVAAAGALPFGPAAMLVSFAVTVASSVGFTWAASRVARARMHVVSPVISALLLFFIFWPTLEPARLSALVLAGAVVGVSKYVLMWRGRHVFNPAALAAVVITLTGLDASVWWVATPALLPFVAVGALLVVWRAGEITRVTVFVVIAVALVVARLSGGGSEPLAAVWTAIASYPVVFFAAYMLTEPLTSASRRRSRWVLAVLTAVLFAVPLQVGAIYSSPEWALVIANLIAAFVSARSTRGAWLRLRGSRQIAPGIVEFSFDRPPRMRFVSGQWADVSVQTGRRDRAGARRTFSIVSAPDSDDMVFATRIPAQPSAFKRSLATLGPGDRIRLDAVGGDFTFTTEAPALFIAGGIGVTPFVSQIRSLSSAAHVTVIYAKRPDEVLAYVEELRASDARLEIVERAELSAAKLTELVGDIAARDVLISGSPAFVADATRHSRAAGARRVRRDVFSGY